MGVSIHPITLQIRVGKDHLAYGDPWDLAVDMQMVGVGRAYLSCARGKITKAAYKEICSALRSMGIEKVEWERSRDYGMVCCEREG